MSEWSAVQSPMLRYAAQIVWHGVAPAQALTMRGGDGGLLFTEVLAGQLKALNPGVINDQ